MSHSLSPNIKKSTPLNTYIIKGLTLLFFAFSMGSFVYLRSCDSSKKEEQNTLPNDDFLENPFGPSSKSGMMFSAGFYTASDTGDLPKDSSNKINVPVDSVSTTVTADDIFMSSSKSSGSIIRSDDVYIDGVRTLNGSFGIPEEDTSKISKKELKQRKKMEKKRERMRKKMKNRRFAPSSKSAAVFK